MASVNQESKQLPIPEIIWFFFKPYKLQMLTLLALFLMVGGLEAATIAAIYPILSVAFPSDTVQGNFVLTLFQNMAALLPVQDKFVSYCVLFLTFAVIAFVIKLISVNFRMRFSARVVEENQGDIFRRLVNADYQYFVENKQGDLIYNATAAPLQLSTLMSAVTEFLAQLILAVLVLVLLISLSWQGAAAVLLVAIGYQYLARYLGSRVSYHSGTGEMDAMKEGTVILNETIGGIKHIKVFGIGEERIGRFNNSVKKRWYHSIRRGIWGQIPPLLLYLIVYLSVGVVALVIRSAANTTFTDLIPVFGAFAFAVFRLAPFVTTIGGTIMSVMGSLPDCQSVYKIRNNKLALIEDGGREFGALKTDIRFENASFAYKNRKDTLEGVNLVFEKGKTTAIVGRSGSGKTTIINLLLRLFEVDSGAIKVDGVNVREYRIASWLKHVGFVSQDTFILNDSIRNNITFGSDGYTEEQIIKAARYADAHDFISRLPEGYNTMVGDRGIRLSGGQAQRIAVARAMIRNPEILIFDEATNNLDGISEAAVQKAIEEISKDHTVIIIAHRLSTIVNADKIIVLGDGRIIEQGTHKELIDRKGAYWQLYQSQPSLEQVAED